MILKPINQWALKSLSLIRNLKFCVYSFVDGFDLEDEQFVGGIDMEDELLYLDEQVDVFSSEHVVGGFDLEDEQFVVVLVWKMSSCIYMNRLLIFFQNMILVLHMNT